jgi:hypothetical protein
MNKEVDIDPLPQPNCKGFNLNQLTASIYTIQTINPIGSDGDPK